MERSEKLLNLIREIRSTADREGKMTGFAIGNTAKIDAHSLYYTPIRNTSIMVVGGAIVYSENQAIELARYVDGQVDYILVDAEKKVPDELSLSGEPANVERAVRESVKLSTLWIYKGNDVSVEAVDTLLAQLTKDNITGIGGRKVAILGVGNLGAKLALKLVERGASVAIYRRNQEALETIAAAINYIKPTYTRARVVAVISNENAAEGADVLIGATQGIPVITASMVEALSADAIIVDVGKGVLFPEAAQKAEQRDIPVYRLDVSAAFEGLIYRLWAMEKIIENKMGRRRYNGESIVAGGLLGREGEIVVDDISEPTQVYGIADGKGDFIREVNEEQVRRLQKVRSQIEV
jgi:hypothetical protein